MGHLSERAQDLLRFLREDYIEEGYMYHGCWPMIGLVSDRFGGSAISELVFAGYAERVKFVGDSVQLTSAERKRLIERHSLASVWCEKENGAYIIRIREEVKSVAGIAERDGGIEVPVMKNSDDKETPDVMVVQSPFRVGQVVEMEYDLPRNPHFVGVRPTKAVGQFMVTDIVRNQLVYPRENMIELQSLCEEFNKMYPAERTMQVFEDVVLKKIRNAERALDDRLEDAQERAVPGSSDVSEKDMGIG